MRRRALDPGPALVRGNEAAPGTWRNRGPFAARSRRWLAGLRTQGRRVGRPVAVGRRRAAGHRCRLLPHALGARRARRHAEDEGDRRRHPGRRLGLPQAAVPHDRHHPRPGRADRVLHVDRDHQARRVDRADLLAVRHLAHRRLRPRLRGLGTHRLHRHDPRHPRQRPHGGRRADRQHARCAHRRLPHRRRRRHVHRRPRSARGDASSSSSSRTRARRSSSASASAARCWPCSSASAAASSPRPPTSAPTSSARSRPASPRTTRATRRRSPTTSATTSATAPAWPPTSSRATRSPSSPRSSSVSPRSTRSAANPALGLIFPLAARAIGVVASIAGVFAVKARPARPTPCARSTRASSSPAR